MAIWCIYRVKEKKNWPFKVDNEVSNAHQLEVIFDDQTRIDFIKPHNASFR